MKNDQLDNKYKEITQEIQKEKMKWDFEDFLEKTKEDKTIPLNKNKGGSISKFYWMAASVVLLLALGINYQNAFKNSIEEKDHLVKNEILLQKKDFENNNVIIATNSTDSLKMVTDSLLTDSISTADERKSSDLMDQILPKRGRIKRDLQPRFVENTKSEKIPEKSKTSQYESNYVMINGQKIENEQEAIDLTKYSFRILSENVSKTVAQTEALNSFTNDY